MAATCRRSGVEHDAVDRREPARGVEEGRRRPAPSPVTTICAARSRRSTALSKAMCMYRFSAPGREAAISRSAFAPAIVAREHRQPDQVLRRDRIVVRGRFVGRCSGPDHQALRVGRSEVITAPLRALA